MQYQKPCYFSRSRTLCWFLCKYIRFRPSQQNFSCFFLILSRYLPVSLRNSSLLSNAMRWRRLKFSCMSTSVLLYKLRMFSAMKLCTRSSTSGMPSSCGDKHNNPLGTSSTRIILPVCMGSPSKCATPSEERWMVRF